VDYTVDFYDLTLVATVLAVVEIIGIFLAVGAVMRPRSSQAAIAWSIALIALPFVTIPLYIIFGRWRFRGYQKALREKEALVGERLTDWFERMSATATELQEGLEAVEDLVKALTQIPFTRGNHVELLVDGEATYGAMFDAITAAESYVLVQFYIVMDGTVARRMREALIQKARSGVRVYFLYDKIGCWSLPASYLNSMRDVSIEVSGFRTTRGSHNRFQINLRNHRFVELASFTYYSEMMDCGVRLFRYQDRFLHQKVFLVDDCLTGIRYFRMIKNVRIARRSDTYCVC
jgi:cardiolipin synthase